jgi:uncharacterized protein
MHLYDCQVGLFIPQATSGQIADILRKKFVDRLEYSPSPAEFRSWRNSLGAFAEAIDGVGMDDAWVVLEYQLPLASSRVDCMLVGSDSKRENRSVLVEFKQWDNCTTSYVPETVIVGGIEHLHPSAQVHAYRQYLEDAHSVFVDRSVVLSSCAYLHNVNATSNACFYHPRYQELLLDSPAFCLETLDELARFVGEQTRFGAERTLVDRILHGHYRPSKKLLDYVADSIDKYEPWKLLDEQRLVFNKIFADVEQARESGQKKVIAVTGGPGTGKSVIALQVVGAAARKGYAVVHATGSKAFTTNLRGVVRRSEPFNYFYHICRQPPDSLELVICDEAHRLRKHNNLGYRIISERPQAEEIIDAACVSVFLLDGQQSVRADEVGSVFGLQDYAESQGIDFALYDLQTQFRCAGSESYLRWVNHVLGLSHQPSLAWLKGNEYEIRTFDQVQAMEALLQDKIRQGHNARLVAGFCWEWSSATGPGLGIESRKICGKEAVALKNRSAIPTKSGPANRRAFTRSAASIQPRASSLTTWASFSAGISSGTRRLTAGRLTCDTIKIAASRTAFAATAP